MLKFNIDGTFKVLISTCGYFDMEKLKEEVDDAKWIISKLLTLFF